MTEDKNELSEEVKESVSGIGINRWWVWGSPLQLLSSRNGTTCRLGLTRIARVLLEFSNRAGTGNLRDLELKYL